MISFHTQHDAGLCVSADSETFVLELERLFGERHFASSEDPDVFVRQWRQAIDVAYEFTGVRRFDVAVTSWVMPSARRRLAELVEARAWTTVDHHRAHAAMGHFDAGFERSLVVSYDGGGNDGTFNVYSAEGTRIDLLERVRLNLGLPYRFLASAMPEVTNGRAQPRGGHLSLAGKLMAYGALGRPREEWKPALRDYYRWFQYPRQAAYTLGEAIDLPIETDALSPDEARDLAATSQSVFEELLLDVVGRHVAQYEADGIVLTGGGALNVIANQRVRDASSLPVHVPFAPNDAGVALGAAWCVDPPVRPAGAYLGCRLREVPARLDAAVSIDVGGLAERLVGGAVIGVARDRAEAGPRALGNRSILCYPDRADLKDRLNGRVKFREAYRPYGPAIPEDAARHFFGCDVRSPYMSFAPRLRPEIAARFPAVAHVDGTARVQTVSGRENRWLLALLREVGRRTGDPILLNTSFNSAGRPMVHDHASALKMLDDSDLDAVVIEDRIVERPARCEG